MLTNDGGEFITIDGATFAALVSGTLDAGSPAYLNLMSKQFLTVDADDPVLLRVAASQWRTKKAFVEGGPKLHMFVPTLRCNQSCGYCQVSRVDVGRPGVDMARETADKAIDLMLMAPSPSVTMEFQGGEPLLAFDLVRRMIETTAERAEVRGKQVRFVVCTNLTLLEDAHLACFRRHEVAVSTSLDGPAFIHDRNRPWTGAAAHDRVVANIDRCREALGPEAVSALMTTTRLSLGHGREIVDEYISLGLGGIFLRQLNPYGYAAKSEKSIGYHVSEFIVFYRELFDYIMELNQGGVYFQEGYASILLRKILTPYGVGFVDLQSPTGAGFGTVLYNYDASVYPSDEARMLGEMGDYSFRLGTVDDGWMTLFLGETMQGLAAAGIAEGLPGCSDCVYVPYCGADPIRNYRSQGDMVGHRPTSDFCRKQQAHFAHLFGLLDQGDPSVMRVLASWVAPERRHLPRVPWRS